MRGMSHVLLPCSSESGQLHTILKLQRGLAYADTGTSLEELLGTALAA